MPTYHIFIFGHVHGVGFRYMIEKYAKELGICGSVRNTDNQAVEIYLSANSSQLQSVLAWCSRGPRGARVDAVTVAKVSSRTFDDFSIIQ